MKISRPPYSRVKAIATALLADPEGIDGYTPSLLEGMTFGDWPLRAAVSRAVQHAIDQIVCERRYWRRPHVFSQENFNRAVKEIIAEREREAQQ